jgi:hypothetical protein
VVLSFRYATASARSDGLLLLCGGRDGNSVVCETMSALFYTSSIPKYMAFFKWPQSPTCDFYFFMKAILKIKENKNHEIFFMTNLLMILFSFDLSQQPLRYGIVDR